MNRTDSLQPTVCVASAKRLLRAHPLLVVEDSDEDFDTVLMAAQLAGIHHEIRRSLTGDDGLSQLRGVAGHARVQVAMVLLDLNTPHGDGRYALEQMHADPQLSSIPVVVLSTSANPRDVDFCYEHGANAFHVKPVSHSEYLLLLQTLLSYWLSSVVLTTAHTLER